MAKDIKKRDDNLLSAVTPPAQLDLKDILKSRRQRIQNDSDDELDSDSENDVIPRESKTNAETAKQTAPSTDRLFTRNPDAPAANIPNNNTRAADVIPDIIEEENEIPREDKHTTPSSSEQLATAITPPATESLFIKRVPPADPAPQPAAWTGSPPPLLSEFMAARKNNPLPPISAPVVEKKVVAPQKFQPESMLRYDQKTAEINTRVKALKTSVENARLLPDNERQAFLDTHNSNIEKINSLAKERDRLAKIVLSDFETVRPTSISHKQEIHADMQMFERSVDREQRYLRQELQQAKRKLPVVVMPIAPAKSSADEDAFDFRPLEALAEQPNLTELNLPNITPQLKSVADINQFHQLLVTILSQHPEIKKIDLSNNAFTTAQREKLIDALSKTPNLESIMLNNVDFEQTSAVTQFLKALAHHEHLASIHLENAIPEAALAKLKKEAEEWFSESYPDAVFPTDYSHLSAIKDYVYEQRLHLDNQINNILKDIQDMRNRATDRTASVTAENAGKPRENIREAKSKMDADVDALAPSHPEDEMQLEDFEPEEDLNFTVHYASSDQSAESLPASEQKYIDDDKSTQPIAELTEADFLPFTKMLTDEDDLVRTSIDEDDELFTARPEAQLTDADFRPQTPSSEDDDQVRTSMDDEEFSDVNPQTNKDALPSDRPTSSQAWNDGLKSPSRSNLSFDFSHSEPSQMVNRDEAPHDKKAPSKSGSHKKHVEEAPVADDITDAILTIDTIENLHQFAQMVTSGNLNAAPGVFDDIQAVNLNRITRHSDSNERQIAVDDICNLIARNFSIQEISLDHNRFTTENLELIIAALLKAKDSGSPLEKISLRHAISAHETSALLEDLVKLKRVYKENLQLDSKTQRAVTRLEAEQLTQACEKYMTYLANEIVIPEFKKSHYSYVYSADKNLMGKIVKDAATNEATVRPLLQNQRCAIAIARYQLLQKLYHTLNNERTPNRAVRAFDNHYQRLKKEFPQTCPEKDRPQEIIFLRTIGETDAVRRIQTIGYLFKGKHKQTVTRPQTAAKNRRGPQHS